jgi:ATP-dependent exoDNAse (exonuclease V) beta subunit
VQQKNLKDQVEEHYRLLYVAMTRAQDRLIVFGKKKLIDDPRTWFGVLPASMGNREVDDSFFPSQGHLSSAADTTHHPSTAHAISPLTQEVINILKKEPTPGAVVPTLLQEYEPVAPSSAAALRGIHIHQQLESLGRSGTLYTQQATPLIQQLMQRVEDKRFFTAPSLYEVDFFYEGHHGRIDQLTILHEEQHIWVVDYKTGTMKNPPPKAYQEQVQLYKKAVQSFYPTWVVRGFLMWVDHAQVVEVDG